MCVHVLGMNKHLCEARMSEELWREGNGVKEKKERHKQATYMVVFHIPFWAIKLSVSWVSSQATPVHKDIHCNLTLTDI